MILSELDNSAVSDARTRPLHEGIDIRTPRSAQTDSMANSIVIDIKRSSIRGKLGLVLASKLSLQVCLPAVFLQIVVEVGQAGEDLEILIAG